MAEMVQWFAHQRDHLLEIGKNEYINAWVSGPGGSPLPGIFFGMARGMRRKYYGGAYPDSHRGITRRRAPFLEVPPGDEPADSVPPDSACFAVRRKSWDRITRRIDKVDPSHKPLQRAEAPRGVHHSKAAGRRACSPWASRLGAGRVRGFRVASPLVVSTLKAKGRRKQPWVV